MKTYQLTNTYALHELIDDIVVIIGGYTMRDYNKIKDSLMVIEDISEEQKNLTMSDITTEWAIQHCHSRINVSQDESEMDDNTRDQYVLLHNELSEQFESV